MAITALASGLPVFTPVEFSTKRYSAFEGFETLYHLKKDSEPDLDWFLGRLGKTEPSRAAQSACDKLARHWDRIAAVLIAGPITTQPALNRFWQSLPNLLEAAETESFVKQRRIDELSKLLALARAEIVARDDRIATLYDSPSMKVTTPMRFLMRGLKHLMGK